MKVEVIKNSCGVLVYLGKRSLETRFVVLGAHNVRTLRSFRGLEFSYFPKNRKGRTDKRVAFPRYRTGGGPFFVFSWSPIVEILVGWRSNKSLR